MLRFRYRILLLLACGLIFTGYTRNTSAVNKDDEAEVEVVEIKNVKTEQFKIYDGDYGSYKEELAKVIEIEENLELEDKFDRLMKSLSETLYDDYKIETRIEDRDGKKIAIVNLVEEASSEMKSFENIYKNMKDEDKQNTWKYKFTSGVAKAIVILESFDATIMQYDYDGEWIDGYMIYHNSETLKDVYRNKTVTDIKWR